MESMGAADGKAWHTSAIAYRGSTMGVMVVVGFRSSDLESEEGI